MTKEKRAEELGLELISLAGMCPADAYRFSYSSPRDASILINKIKKCISTPLTQKPSAQKSNNEENSGAKF